MAAGSSVSSQLFLVLGCMLALYHAAHGGAPFVYNKNTKETGCIVQHDTSFKTPDSVHILSYITPKQPMSIGLTYIGRDNNSYRDVVKLSNTEATHRRVWENGSYTADRHLFPINITKGWNTLTLTAAEDEITLTYLTREDGEVREQRHLNSTIKTIYLEGNFSICSGASPEWLVSENGHVAVPLDYQSDAGQLLEVTGDGNATAFLKLSDGEKYVPAITTLALSTTQQPSGYIVEVFQVNEGDEYLGNYSSSEPAVVMGSRQGNSHLRLKRDTSSPPPTTTESTECIVPVSAEEKEIPFNSSILSYITSDSFLSIVLTFEGHDKDVYRDEITVFNNEANYAAVRSKVLRSKRSPSHVFPTPVSEGWVTLRLDAEDKNVTLSWVSGKDEVILYTQSTFNIMDKLYLTGKFSVCSGESPEWLLEEGKEVEVPLDLLDHMQQLELTGQGNAAAFLKLLSGQINLPANTILTVNTKRNGSDYIVEVSFKVSNGERFHIEQPPRAQPVLVIGGLRGNTRLHLNRSASSSSLPLPSSSPSPAQSPSSPLGMIILVFIIFFGV